MKRQKVMDRVTLCFDTQCYIVGFVPLRDRRVTMNLISRSWYEANQVPQVQDSVTLEYGSQRLEKWVKGPVPRVIFHSVKDYWTQDLSWLAPQSVALNVNPIMLRQVSRLWPTITAVELRGSVLDLHSASILAEFSLKHLTFDHCTVTALTPWFYFSQFDLDVLVSLSAFVSFQS